MRRAPFPDSPGHHLRVIDGRAALMGIVEESLREAFMNPVESTWRWWINLVDFPLWDPWLATLALISIGLLVFYGLHELLRP